VPGCGHIFVLMALRCGRPLPPPKTELNRAASKKLCDPRDPVPPIHLAVEPRSTERPRNGCEMRGHLRLQCGVYEKRMSRKGCAKPVTKIVTTPPPNDPASHLAAEAGGVGVGLLRLGAGGPVDPRAPEVRGKVDHPPV